MAKESKSVNYTNSSASSLILTAYLSMLQFNRRIPSQQCNSCMEQKCDFAKGKRPKESIEEK